MLTTFIHKKKQKQIQNRKQHQHKKGRKLTSRSKKCSIQQRRVVYVYCVRQPGQNMAFYENPNYVINFTYLQA